MKAAIDAQLAMHGFGNVCLDGPNVPGSSGRNADSDPRERAAAKDRTMSGFVRVTSTAPSPRDGSLDTTHDLTAKGRAGYVTYEKLGWSGEFHGWCFAEFRVGRSVRNTTPADVMGHTVTTVTYYPRIVRVENRAKKAPATSVPAIHALASFESKTARKLWCARATAGRRLLRSE